MQEVPDITGLTGDQVQTLWANVQARMREELGIPGPPPPGPQSAPDTLSGPTGPPDTDEPIQIDHEEDDDQWGPWGSEHLEELQGPHPPQGPPERTGNLMVPMPKWAPRRMPSPAQTLMAADQVLISIHGAQAPRGRPQGPQGPHGSRHASPCQSPRSRSAYGDNEQQRWLHRGSQDHYASRLEQDRGAIQPGAPGSPVRGDPLQTFASLMHLATTASLGCPGSSTSTACLSLLVPLEPQRMSPGTSASCSGRSSHTARQVPR